MILSRERSRKPKVCRKPRSKFPRHGEPPPPQSNNTRSMASAALLTCCLPKLLLDPLEPELLLVLGVSESSENSDDDDKGDDVNSDVPKSLLPASDKQSLGTGIRCHYRNRAISDKCKTKQSKIAQVNKRTLRITSK